MTHTAFITPPSLLDPLNPQYEFLNERIQSLDFLFVDSIPPGAVTLETGELHLNSGGGPGAEARAFRFNYGYVIPFTWDKQISITSRVTIKTGDNVNTFMEIAAGRPEQVAKRIGFKFQQNCLYGVTADGTNRTETLLKNDIVMGTQYTFKLQAILYPGVKCAFYLNDVLIANAATNLPAGADTSEILWGLWLQCYLVATVYIKTFEIMIARYR